MGPDHLSEIARHARHVEEANRGVEIVVRLTEPGLEITCRARRSQRVQADRRVVVWSEFSRDAAVAAISASKAAALAKLSGSADNR